MNSLAEMVYGLSVWAVPLLLAITLHEAAHGYAALKLGDDTAQRLGRISINPLRHIDPFGTVAMPVLLLLLSGGSFMFGYAKPVPVAFHRLRNPRLDMVKVAAAGPLCNILQAWVAALLLHVLNPPLSGLDAWFAQVLNVAIYFNLLLAVFNMLPLPPLDGGRVAVGLLPDSLARPLARLERHGFALLLALFFVLPWLGAQLGRNWSIFQAFILPVTRQLRALILPLAGHF
ncbi:site-2 protease family protein [Candidatus Foliamicus sp.]